jgi:hypothetical protein
VIKSAEFLKSFMLIPLSLLNRGQHQRDEELSRKLFMDLSTTHRFCQIYTLASSFEASSGSRFEVRRILGIRILMVTQDVRLSDRFGPPRA